MSNLIKFPYKFTCRHYQADLFHAFFIEGYKRLISIEHRRAGKDKAFLNLMIAAMLQRKGTYLYAFPTFAQARGVIWDGIDREGMPYLDHFPPELVADKNEAMMRIKLKNGSIFRLVGTDHYNRLRGQNPIGYISSETQHHHPLAWEIISVVLAENGGWAAFNGTPQGYNHFYDLYNTNKKNSKWFTRILTVDDTFRSPGVPVISKEIIEEERRAGRPEEIIQQEYYCSFEASLPGAYYGSDLKKAYEEKRIKIFDIEEHLPVYTAWDLGLKDPTAIWFIQPHGHELRLIYYYENRDQGIEHYINFLHELADLYHFKYARHYAPHDIMVREFTNNRTRYDTAQKMGLTFTLAPNLGAGALEEGIIAVKTLFQRFWIHEENCKQGIECLKQYHAEQDIKHGVYKSAPLHDWSSDGCDALRYFAVSWQDNIYKGPPSYRYR